MDHADRLLLHQKIEHLLTRDPATLAIRFTMDVGRPVTPAAYALLALRMGAPAEGRRRADRSVLIHTNEDHVDGDAAALYAHTRIAPRGDPRVFPRDSLLVRGLEVFDHPVDRAVVLHECTHALQDLWRIEMMGPDAEAGAWIAEAYYHHNRGNRTAAEAPDAMDDDQRRIWDGVAPLLDIVTELKTREEANAARIPSLTPEERVWVRRYVGSSARRHRFNGIGGCFIEGPGDAPLYGGPPTRRRICQSEAP